MSIFFDFEVFSSKSSTTTNDDVSTTTDEDDTSSYSIRESMTTTTTDSENDLLQFSKTIKHVRFNTIIHVILIPSRIEYAKMYHELWYSSFDYKRFRFNYQHNE